MMHNTELDTLNNQLKMRSVQQRLAWAADTFGSGLFALTSAGIDSALTIEHLTKVAPQVPIIHINTGFLPPETLQFLDTLKEKYGFKLYEFGPTEKEIEMIRAQQLWRTQPEEYSRLTKLEPLSVAITTLGVSALISGVRHDQTERRSHLGVLGRGNNGEVRIHPFIDWSQAMVNDYFEIHKLPRHPLYFEGYGSVEDAQTMTVGEGRTGRAVMECGIHMENGRIVRNNAPRV